MTARQLLRARGNASSLTAENLERWLLTNGFAERRSGPLLVPTRRGMEIGGALAFLD